MVDLSKTDHPPYVKMAYQDYGSNIPPVFVTASSHYPQLFFTDPSLVEDIFVRCNKYITKSPHIKNMMYPLMGESILLSESNSDWSNKRKVLSTAFYKDKLIKMIEIIKELLKEAVIDWN